MSLGIKKIADYEIQSHLGKGGMGDVYKAYNPRLDRTVALKVLLPQVATEEARTRFDVEAKAVARLDHTNIVTLYQYGEDQGLIYFAMQYVDGKDLFAILTKNDHLPISLTLNYAKQICRGLQYAHKRNVVHRDIKPHNILVDRNDGSCWVTDFGIAQLLRGDRITVTGMAIGTPEYMSPEQAGGKELDHQTDIYSFGILLYEMCAGEPPFTDVNPVTVAYKQVNEIPKPPSYFNKKIPNRLELIILKCLKKDKKERYQSVRQILNDLDSVEVMGETGLFKSSTPASTKSSTDKRITDRRQGDRRTANRRAVVVGPPKFNLFSLSYLKYSLPHQWLSVVLIVLALFYFVLRAQ